MKRAALICGGLTLALGVLSIISGDGGCALADTAAQPAPSAPQSMKGQVVMLSGEVCVVKDATGKSILFKVDKGTQIDGSVKEGKTVEVSASADGRALTIKESS